MKENLLPQKSIKEEIFNSLTHGIGAVFSILAAIILIKKASLQGTVSHIVSFSFYSGSLILLYVFSTLYHALTHEGAKKVFRRLDHIGIYLLIFGSYFPICLVMLKGTFGWTLFGIECGLCVIGIIFKAVFGTRFAFMSTLFYLLMGWMALFAIKPIYLNLDKTTTSLILLGGVFYTLGVIFFAIDTKVKYFHAIWHLFVLGGSLAHFLMMLTYKISPNL